MAPQDGEPIVWRRAGRGRRLGRRWRHWRHYTPVNEIVLSIVVVAASLAAVIGTAFYLGIV